ncbi:MAG: M16 family metallopeptidase [Limnochordia bacterium]|jgi:predicted Zn-dependent peptidase
MKRSVCLTLAILLTLATSAIGSAAELSITATVEKVVLDNGVTLLLKENPAFDIIALSLLTGAGSVHDPEGLEGLTYLTQRNLLSGTHTRSGQDLVVALESLGIQLQATASYDYSAVLMQATPSAFRPGLDILMDMLENPAFPEAEFERERRTGLAEYESLYDEPINAVLFGFLEVFYGDHPYRYSPYGSGEGLLAATREDAANWHRYIYQPEKMVVAVVGNFATAEILPVLEDRFGRLKDSFPGTPVPRADQKFIYPDEDRQLVINLPTQAAFMVIGYPAPETFGEDAPAMAVINSVLGEGMSSRLFTEIRDKRGLAYTVLSQYSDRLGPSSLFTFLATHPDNVDEAREHVLLEIQRFAEEGLSPEEIAWVAGQKRGAFIRQNETNLSQSALLAVAELVGFGYQWVDEYLRFYEEVTPEDITAAAQKYFQNYTEVLITP